ncbi:MAG: hypothetical protein Q7J54_07815 [Candidatus Woesearchaeota archaeon]|nr:hypothetical protein [Candidatus Woesearchaeota archaeon]
MSYAKKELGKKGILSSFLRLLYSKKYKINEAPRKSAIQTRLPTFL